jgi:plasmid stability protein
MKNITLSIDDDLLRDIRKYAAEHNTSVNALVRARLAELVAPKKRIKDAVKRMRKLAKEGGMEVGRIAWTRDDLHER